jgi:hypothetical protein
VQTQLHNNRDGRIDEKCHSYVEWMIFYLFFGLIVDENS